MIRFLIVNLSLMWICSISTSVFAQADYNNCSQALYLCPLVPQNVTNYSATKTVCTGCEDDFNYCFAPANTIWMTFETNSLGGSVQVNFNNVTIENVTGQGTEMQATIIQAIAPCDASTYTQIGNCEFAATGPFVLNATGLAPNATYYIVINGASGPGIAPAQATMDISISGPGVERIPPGLALFVPSTTICEGQSILCSAFVGDCPDTTDYHWFINNQLVAITQTNDFETSALKQGDRLSVATTCFQYCIVEISDTTIPFTVVSFPVDAGPDFTIQQGGSIALIGSTTAPIYKWSPDYSLSSGTSLGPIAHPTETTIYTFSATENGCTFSDQCTVFVEETLSLTNTFTPNDDGFNDTWEIPSLENYPNCLVEIFDRWGQSVYQTSGYNPKKAWDGKSKGKKLEAGVYFYVIDLRDPAFNAPFRGTITLIR